MHTRCEGGSDVGDIQLRRDRSAQLWVENVDNLRKRNAAQKDSEQQTE